MCRQCIYPTVSHNKDNRYECMHMFRSSSEFHTLTRPGHPPFLLHFIHNLQDISACFSQFPSSTPSASVKCTSDKDARDSQVVVPTPLTQNKTQLKISRRPGAVARTKIPTEKATAYLCATSQEISNLLVRTAHWEYTATAMYIHFVSKKTSPLPATHTHRTGEKIISARRRSKQAHITAKRMTATSLAFSKQHITCQLTKPCIIHPRNEKRPIVVLVVFYTLSNFLPSGYTPFPEA